MTYASLASSKRSAYRKNQNSVYYASRATTLGPVSNFVTLLVLTFLLAVFWLSQIASTTGYSDRLDDLKKQRTQLQETHASLQLEAANLRSTETVRTSGVANNLTSPRIINSY